MCQPETVSERPNFRKAPEEMAAVAGGGGGGGVAGGAGGAGDPVKEVGIPTTVSKIFCSESKCPLQQIPVKKEVVKRRVGQKILNILS